jgi:hypothetical protein
VIFAEPFQVVDSGIAKGTVPGTFSRQSGLSLAALVPLARQASIKESSLSARRNRNEALTSRREHVLLLPT